MVVVFSVNGALASYALIWVSQDHVTAQLMGNGDKRKDIPEKVEFLKSEGNWSSSSSQESVSKSIIHALTHTSPSLEREEP